MAIQDIQSRHAPDASDRDGATSPGGTAWSEFCDRLKEVGQRILADEGVVTLDDEAEALRFLTAELRAALEWEVHNADPDFPHIFREEECGAGPLGPNMDNSYWYARIDPARAYRLTIDTRTIFDIVIGVTTLGMKNLGDYSLSAFTIGEDGLLEILISADRQPGNWLYMPPEVEMLGIRVYYHDWERDSPPPVQIERLGSAAEAPARLSCDMITQRLEASIARFDRTFRVVPSLRQRIDKVGENNVARVPVAEAAGPIQYGAGRYRLAEGEALILEFRPPDARYWCVNLYTLPWMSLIDPLNTITARNDLQARIDPDGMVRMVIAQHDPGVPNWLGCGGFMTGACWYRWIWSKDHPTVQTRLVPAAEIRRHLHPDTPFVSLAERAEEISRRRRHLTHRIRF
jgi:hypothetical protein